jgi:hypothetical protein
MSTILRNKHWINRLPHIYELDDLMAFCRRNKRIYIYGRGEAQEWLLRFLDMCGGVNVAGYVVSFNPDESNFCYRKLPVKLIDDIINQALDHILLMKILPRIEGDSDMFNLSKDFKQKNNVEYNNRLEWLMDLAPEIMIEEQEGDDHRQTAREKIKEMIERLENQEFTRFWP